MTLLEQATEDTQRMRLNCPDETKSFLITAAQLLNLLTGEDGTYDGVRVYVGEDSTGKKQGYAVPTQKDSNGVHNDVNIANVKKAYPCPSYCPVQSNVLNS